MLWRCTAVNGGGGIVHLWRNNKDEEEVTRQRNALKLWRMIRSLQSSDILFKKAFTLTLYLPRLRFNLTDDISRKLLMLAVKSLNQRADSRAVSLT